MYSNDKSGFKKFLLHFHEQISESAAILKKAGIAAFPKSINNIIYLGMGGSGIAGELLTDALYDDLHIPLRVISSYQMPGYCNSNTLVIASSYSGDTEEIISAVQFAEEKKAHIVTISSGGELQKLAKKKKWPHISIPGGYPPRQALGYLFFPIYHLLGQNGFINNYNSDLSDLVMFVKKIIRMNDYPNVEGHVLSKELAHKIQGKIPIFYSTAPYLRTIARRWQNQMHESAKSLAFSNTLPEMNHNEILGWEMEGIPLNNFIVIFLENENLLPRIQKRIELSKKIINRYLIDVVDIYTSGTKTLEKVFSMVILGDWVSYYLALDYKKDPVEIENVNYLKSEMAKM